MRFRKRPVEVEAVQYLSNYNNLPDWAKNAGCETYCSVGRVMEICTLEGTMIANSGDWIIRGVKGEVYPCKPDIFAATYEVVEP